MKYTKEDIVVLDEQTIKPYQEEILKMTKDVVAFFDAHNIQYSLSGGSILGAVRHKGFIPWDDDIDLNMPRKDYNTMLELFDKELGDKYYLQTPEKNPELGLMVTQVRKKGTIARRKYDWNSKECGISIDIYILENVFSNRILKFIQKSMSMAFSYAISSVRYINNMNIPREIQELEARQINYSKSKSIIGHILKIIPMKQWISWCNFWNSACRNNESELVAIPTGRKHFAGEIYRRKDMCVFEKQQFETERFNIPVWAKEYLERFYGDYMSIPPVEKRERHVFLELKY